MRDITSERFVFVNTSTMLPVIVMPLARSSPKTRGRQPDAEITAPQAEALRAIAIITEAHGFPPTMKQLETLGISHDSAHEP